MIVLASKKRCDPSSNWLNKQCLRKLKGVIEYDLLQTYCCSLYEFVLWQLIDLIKSQVCSAWQITLREFAFCPITHSNHVFTVITKKPLLDDVCRHVINFHFTCVLVVKMQLSKLFAQTDCRNCAPPFIVGGI